MTKVLSIWQRERDDDLVIKILLFLISPFCGLVYSFYRIRTKSSFIILFLFAIVYGFSMIVESSLYMSDATYYLDGNHHRADFEQYVSMTYENFVDMILHPFENGERDIYHVIMKFLVSRFTSNYHVFFCCISMVFMAFSLKSLKYFIKELPSKLNFICYVLLFLFLNIQIFQINGVRFYTAAWIAIYAILQIYISKDRKYLLLLAVTPLVHSAFWVLLLLVIIKSFTGNFSLLWKILFLTSFFASELFTNFISSNINVLPDSFSEWGAFYLNTQTQLGDGGRFYSVFGMLSRYCIYFLIFLLIRISNKLEGKTQSIFIFLIILATFSSAAQAISNLGGRFFSLLIPIFAYVCIVNYTIILANYGKKFFYLIPICFFYSFFYYMPSLYMKVLEPCFFYASPIYLFNRYLIEFVV